MRKFHKAVLVGAVIGSVCSLGGTTAFAHGDPDRDIDVTQNTECRSHDMNVELLGNISALTGTLANALNGEGNPGAQQSHLGSDMGCNNQAF